MSDKGDSDFLSNDESSDDDLEVFNEQAFIGSKTVPTCSYFCTVMKPCKVNACAQNGSQQFRDGSGTVHKLLVGTNLSLLAYHMTKLTPY